MTQSMEALVLALSHQVAVAYTQKTILLDGSPLPYGSNGEETSLPTGSVLSRRTRMAMHPNAGHLHGSAP